MVLEPDNRMKQKMAKNGSVLQFMYSVAGAGKGLAAMGVMLIWIAVLLAAALFRIIGTQKAVMVAAGIIVPGILLAAAGVSIQKKRERGWAAAYTKLSGMDEKELHQVDQEFQQPGTVLFSFDKGKDSNSLKKMGFITANYIKFPGINPFLLRLDDLVACFYTKKMLCRDGGYDHGFIAYPVEGEWTFVMDSPPEKASLEIVKLVKEHNPKVITDHFFAYEGKEYDAFGGMEEVIELHKRVYGKR